MQYVVGTTLADLLSSRKNISVAESLSLATQIAEGLAEAHSQGIIHRDIKPANVMVNEKGQVKILDFGLAKFIEADADAETSVRLNSSGAVMGTVPFMSPEQLRGKTVDKRTDIFSLGALLYEMLAGKPAFNRDSNAETISSILNDEPDLSAIPEDLLPVVTRCLAKSVEGRYSSAGELLSDLRQLETATGLDASKVITLPGK
jgi:serine/threonine-protein kinase